jgi:hypothetical protein
MVEPIERHLKSIGKILIEIMSEALTKSTNLTDRAAVTISPKFGDYRCTSTMSIFKKNKGSSNFGFQNCKDLADSIITNITDNDCIEKAVSFEVPGVNKAKTKKKSKKGKKGGKASKEAEASKTGTEAAEVAPEEGKVKVEEKQTEEESKAQGIYYPILTI